MQLRSVRVLFFCAVFASFCAHNGPAPAAQPALQAFRVHVPPLLTRAGQGCGWDYACPPDPDFGRPPNLRGSQVIIHNNYGPVNVYPGGAPQSGRHEGGDKGDCRDGGRWGCGDPWSAEKCGPLCWMRRFRHGYCGHGCSVYREQARVEAEERAEDAVREELRRERKHENFERDESFEKRATCDRPYCPENYSPPPPPHYYDGPERAYAPPRRYEGPHPGDLTPRERFEGPRYPADCKGGGC